MNISVEMVVATCHQPVSAMRLDISFSLEIYVEKEKTSVKSNCLTNIMLLNKFLKGHNKFSACIYTQMILYFALCRVLKVLIMFI